MWCMLLYHWLMISIMLERVQLGVKISLRSGIFIRFIIGLSSFSLLDLRIQARDFYRKMILRRIRLCTFLKNRYETPYFFLEKMHQVPSLFAHHSLAFFGSHFSLGIYIVFWKLWYTSYEESSRGSGTDSIAKWYFCDWFLIDSEDGKYSYEYTRMVYRFYFRWLHSIFRTRK